jgi:hypothetical protein
VHTGEDTNKFFSDLLGRGVHAFSLAASTLSSQFITAAHLRCIPAFTRGALTLRHGS